MNCQQEILLTIEASVCLNWDNLQWNGATEAGTGTFTPLAGQQNSCTLYALTDGGALTGNSGNVGTPATLASDGNQCHCRMTVQWTWTGVTPDVGLAIAVSDGSAGTFGPFYTRSIANPSGTYIKDFYVDNGGIPFNVEVIAVINANNFLTAGDATAQITFSII